MGKVGVGRRAHTGEEGRLAATHRVVLLLRTEEQVGHARGVCEGRG